MSEKIIILPSAKIQHLNVEPDFLKWQVPVRILCMGASETGKSQWCLSVIKNRSQLFNAEFYRIIYAFPESANEMNNDFIEKLRIECPSIEIHFGLPNANALDLNLDKRPKLIIIDDMFNLASKMPEIRDLFQIDSHHSNISVILTTQNMYEQSKFSVSIARSTSVKVLMKDLSDQLVLSTISRRIFPTKSNFLSEAFQFLDENFSDMKYQYIVIDSNPKSKLPQKMMIYSKIFPNENNEIIPLFFVPT